MTRRPAGILIIFAVVVIARFLFISRGGKFNEEVSHRRGSCPGPWPVGGRPGGGGRPQVRSAGRQEGPRPVPSAQRYRRKGRQKVLPVLQERRQPRGHD